jgi:hypothetical protein
VDDCETRQKACHEPAQHHPEPRTEQAWDQVPEGLNGDDEHDESPKRVRIECAPRPHGSVGQKRPDDRSRDGEPQPSDQLPRRERLADEPVQRRPQREGGSSDDSDGKGSFGLVHREDPRHVGQDQGHLARQPWITLRRDLVGHERCSQHEQSADAHPHDLPKVSQHTAEEPDEREGAHARRAMGRVALPIRADDQTDREGDEQAPLGA